MERAVVDRVVDPVCVGIYGASLQRNHPRAMTRMAGRVTDAPEP
jgi:hypothetical protein